MQRMTCKRMCELTGATSVSRRGDVFTARRQFYFTHGRTAKDLADNVLKAFPGAKILEKEEIWKAFNGGAPVSRQSHWLVRFTLEAKGE